jgi:two-component system chemotaxis sensor kinase CheA
MIPTSSTKKQSSADHGFVHVHLDRLDGLLNLVGELVINRAAFIEAGRKARSKHGFKEQVLDLVEAIEQVGRVTDEIQERVIKARMVPVANVFNRFKDFIADLSQTSDKEIDLEIKGDTTEIDKKVIEKLAEPLVHLVRNAVDHGLKTASERKRVGKPGRGKVTLNALHEGNHLVIEVRDDGNGIDLDRIRTSAREKGIASKEDIDTLDDKGVIEMLFHPGFSTLEKVTDMSGRGVGLDAARRQVELLGGSLTMESERGTGTVSRIRLPVSMAIIHALLVEVSGETFAIPMEHVEEIIRSQEAHIDTVESCEVLDVRGLALPIARMAEVLELGAEPQPEKFYVVITRSQGSRLGLVVDRVLRRQEIVIKSLTGQISNIQEVSGATIAGDGSVVLILDVPVFCKELIGDPLQSREEQGMGAHDKA